MIILPEDKNIVSLLSGDDARQLLIALFSESDDVPQLSPSANIAYTAIKSKSDRITERKSRSGKSGGAPKNNQNAQKQADDEKTSGSKQNNLPYHYRNRTTTNTVSVPKKDTVVVDNAPAREEEKDKALGRVMAHYMDKVVSTPSPIVAEELREFMQSMEPDVVINAIDRALAENRREWSYIRGILRNWKSAGVKNMADAARVEERRARSIEAAKSARGGKKFSATTGPPPSSGPTQADIDRMKKLIDNMKSSEPPT